MSAIFRKIKNAIFKEIYEQLLVINKKEIGEQNRSWISKLRFCGSNLHVNGKVVVSGARQIEVGHNVHIGDNAFIQGKGGLKIGDNTHISSNLLLYTCNHQYQGKRLPYDEIFVKKPVEIGKNVWIGMNVCIAPGTKIGDGAIIGMGAVISGEVPSLSIVGNQKFRILGYRDSEHYQPLEDSCTYGGANGLPLSV